MEYLSGHGLQMWPSWAGFWSLLCWVVIWLSDWLTHILCQSAWLSPCCSASYPAACWCTPGAAARNGRVCQYHAMWKTQTWVPDSCLCPNPSWLLWALGKWAKRWKISLSLCLSVTLSFNYVKLKTNRRVRLSPHPFSGFGSALMRAKVGNLSWLGSLCPLRFTSLNKGRMMTCKQLLQFSMLSTSRKFKL